MMQISTNLYDNFHCQLFNLHKFLGFKQADICGANLSSTTVMTIGSSSSPSSSSTTGTEALILAASLAPFTVCSLCGENYQQPKVLACFHTFCKPCLEKLIDSPKRSIICPTCRAETQLCASQGVDSLLSDYAAANLIDEQRKQLQQRTGGVNGVAPNADPNNPGGGGGAGSSASGGGPGSSGSGVGGGADSDLLSDHGSQPEDEEGGVAKSLSPPTVLRTSTDSSHPPSPQTTPCTGCKTKDSPAVAHCYDCANVLCANCVAAHKYMHCFEGHRLIDLTEADSSTNNNNNINAINNNTMNIISGKSQTSNSYPVNVRPVKCLQHCHDFLKFFCFSCNIPICKECTLTDHPSALHQYESIADVGAAQLDYMQRLLEEARCKQKSLVQLFKNVDSSNQHLSICFEKAQMNIAETAHLLQQIVDEQRHQALRDLENAYSSKQSSLNLLDRKLQQTMDKLSHTIDFTSRLLQFASPTEVMVFKKLLENRLQAILNYNLDLSMISQYELEFIPNIPASRLAISNTFGYVRHSQDMPVIGNKAPMKPISRPVIGSLPSNGSSPPILGSLGSALSPLSSSLPDYQPNNNGLLLGAGGPGIIGSGGGSALVSSHNQFSPGGGLTVNGMINGLGNLGSSVAGPPVPAHHAFSDSNLLQSKQFGGSSHSLVGPFSCLTDSAAYGYEKWSSAGSDFAPSSFYGSSADTSTSLFFQPGSLPSTATDQQIVELTAKGAAVCLSGSNVNALTSSLFPPKSQIKRHKMIYHCKFGEFGVMEGQFTEPSGVAVNAQNDIIVADTNNHRIQIFDKEGRFKFQFGECGKRDGQLLYPNRVAVNKATGDIVVTERSPTHQIQVYNQYGQFLRKFGANILQHPRGVTVDGKGRVVVVECKVMRVIIFDLMGNVLQKFGCSKYLEFPNGVVTNDKQEIFISDNRAHCVKVFNYDGLYLRQIGGEGLTNYPIGVGVNQMGEIVVADNHNNFNLTIFQQDGSLVNALESKVKHAQCFDVSLLDDGSVVLASKDYRLYIYRYLQVPPMSM